MAEAIVLIIFVIAFGFIWYATLGLIKHPTLNFSIKSKVLAHEPGLEDSIDRVLTYLHSEERATPEELELLLSDEVAANEIINLLYKREQIELLDIDDETWIRLK